MSKPVLRETFVTGYKVTSCGKVFSVSTNWRGYGIREMKQQADPHGYKIVRLTVDGKRRNFRVHKLICFAFHGQKPSSKHEVRHLDGSRDNNNAANLRWGTRSENAKDRMKHGTQYIPEWHKPEFRKKVMAGHRKRSEALAAARGET